MFVKSFVKTKNYKIYENRPLPCKMGYRLCTFGYSAEMYARHVWDIAER